MTTILLIALNQGICIPKAMKGMVPGKATGEQMRWNQYARPVGDSWRVDETYIKVKGQWGYL
ncbi:MAG TPA: hypothetical protein VHY59_04770 [Chthoniobacterales bacterium]|nr:hypothetical protein [Chthoniobacterales bacterium]